MKRSPLKRTAPLNSRKSPEAKVRAFKPKACSARKGGCGQTFVPSRAMQCACGVPCSIAMVAKANEKKAARAAAEDRKATRAKLEELKPLKWFHTQTKLAVHAYVRLRDADKPCISCGTMYAAQWDAGHYKSVGANSTLRYDLANIHKQCSVCNQHLSGNLILYRQNLLPKIGEAEVLRLEGPQPVHKWTRAELERIKTESRNMARELERAKA